MRPLLPLPLWTGVILERVRRFR